ncbi:MAG: glycosyltransferase, partial [Muribaculaceae bacterium]|nr:glycosyltransferase [Muribaculaceae bacterium]
MKQIAIIILNWNGAALLRRYLPSVVKNTASHLADVIVADNGSTDESLQVLRDEFPMVQVIALDKNYGFDEGYNRAIAQVEHPQVVLLNSDVRTP